MARKKKHKSNEPKLPAYSVYPPEDASPEDVYAYELIKIFAGAMQALNGGVLPMPTHWRKHLNDILCFSKRGRPPSPAVAAKHINTRKMMILDAISRANGGLGLNKSKRYLFLEELAAKYKYYDVAEMRRLTQPYESEAIGSICAEKAAETHKEDKEVRVARAKKINEKVAEGKTYDDLLFDPQTTTDDFVAIRQHQKHGTPLEGYEKTEMTEYEKALSWMNQGLNLHIITPGYPRYFYPDKDLMNYLNSRKKVDNVEN